MYTVIKRFTDLQDNGYKYAVGDTYPREGYEPTAERINELSSMKNKQKTPLIKADAVETVAEVTEEPAEKPKRRRRKSE